MKIVIPDNNSIRFVKKQYNEQPSGSAFSNTEAPFHSNYFNRRYEQEINDNLSNIGLYKQKYGDLSNYVVQMYRGESLTIQYLSTGSALDTTLKVKAYDGVGVEITSISVSNQLKIINENFQTKYDNAKIVDKDGFLAIYLTTGTRQYIGNLVTVIQEDSYYLNGDLPTYMAVGQSIKWSGTIGNPNNGTHTITSLTYDETLGVMLAVTSTAFSATSNVSGWATTIHERLPLNAYEFIISDLPLDQCMYFEVTTSNDSFTTIHEQWETDYIYTKQDITDGVMRFDWKDPISKYITDFRTGLTPFCYLPALMYNITPEISGENYMDETGYATLYGTNYKRKFEVTVMAIPRAFVEKLALIMTHKTVYINFKQFVLEIGSESVEEIEDTMLFTYKFTVYEPELLGIYSLDYVNTTDKTTAAKLLIDADNNLKIDNDGNTLLI